MDDLADTRAKLTNALADLASGDTKATTVESMIDAVVRAEVLGELQSLLNEPATDAESNRELYDFEWALRITRRIQARVDELGSGEQC